MSAGSILEYKVTLLELCISKLLKVEEDFAVQSVNIISFVLSASFSETSAQHQYFNVL